MKDRNGGDRVEEHRSPLQAIETSGSDAANALDGTPARRRIASPALIVDFDRALLRGDPTHERLLVALKERPLAVPRLLAAALRGRAALDQTAAEFEGMGQSSEHRPRRPAVEFLVAEAGNAGTAVRWLSRDGVRRGGPSGAEQFDAETCRPEPTPRLQAEALIASHPEGFAFVGRSEADLPIWRAARERFGVDLSPSLRRRAQAENLGIVELSRAPVLARAAVRSMRPHQWLKNLLVFVPFALSVGELGPRDIGVAVLAFACLCLLTSGSYLVNDLFDIEADRRHPRKRDRPIAGGDLPIAAASAIAAALILGSLVFACLLRYAFAAALGSYLVITLAYSFRLKRMAMVDVLVIALLFTLRILAGMLLVSEKPSHWLLMFSIFFFLSLAFMKREVEMTVVRQAGRTTLSGRGYDLDDRLYVLCCGLSSGIASVVIFSLFITATIERSQLTYSAPELLWGVMGLLGYWILRMWMLTTRGLMTDDPILFAARDRTSLLLGGACAVLAFCAQVIRL